MILTNEQRVKCHSIIHGATASTAAVGAGLAQIPLSDNAIITPIQVSMVISLGAVLEVKLTKSAAAGILSTVVAGAIGRGISQVLFGWIPVWGNTINASTAAIITEAAGWSAVKYFENISDEDAKKYNSIKEEGRQEAKLEFDIKLKELCEKFAKSCEGLKQYEQLESFVMGAFAIGIAAANIEGEISKEAKETIELLTVGLGYNLLPNRIKVDISKLFLKTPTFKDAMKIINTVEKIHWYIFDDVVDAILSIDETDMEQKDAFRTAWNERYKTA
ncbi:hypothetical protein G9F72_019395 [Clostridium estertheticum]|uniref:YcjF family protein n=1 Tax=Clostridium estertheticum TaxID=238834 RepID=UPI001651FD96|nr:hypothetical protein [Clostridium estertheticum]MBZ9688498.1 hypothetical protein [Clostridium estertheticum]